MDNEPIIIPMNKAGERAFDVVVSIARRHLNMAREAVDEFVSCKFPKAEIVSEKAMTDLKYTALFELPCGTKCGVTYDYISKEVYLN